MSGSFSYSRDADAASVARERLDRTAAQASVMESAQRDLVGELIGLWPTSAWLAAGARSAQQWLLAYTTLSRRDAARLERIAGVCAAHPALAEVVVSGAMSLRRIEMLARAVTKDRAPHLEPAVPALVELNANTADDEAFEAAVRFWASKADELSNPGRVQPHSLSLAAGLFGGGSIFGQLAPAAFATVQAALAAWIQDPDAADAPYQRGFTERQADALDDLATFALTHTDHPDDTPDHADDDLDINDADTDDFDHEDIDDGVDWDEVWAGDTFDGSHPGEDLDEALTALSEDPDSVDEEVAADVANGFDPLDPMVLLRRRLRRAEKHRRRRIRRRTRARSGVTTNVHVDLRTLAGVRDIDDLDDLVLRGEGWNATKAIADRLVCDTRLVATLFDGKTQVLDANQAAERFSRAQRRALAARDGHCVFPSCTRPPRHCDAHHLKPRENHGPTRVDNGALLCRFHHRLIHEYGWSLLVDDSEHWVAVDPHGSRWTGRPTTPPTPPEPTAPDRDRRPAHQSV